MIDTASDAAGIAQRGEDAIASARHREAIEALSCTPVPALLDAVQAIRTVLLATDPRALRRSVGWFGLLLGKDIALRAESRTLRAQLGVHVLGVRARLAEVAAHRERLAAHRQALRESAAALARHASDLAAKLATADPDAAAPVASRMQHLLALASGYEVTASHIELTLLDHDGLVQRIERMLPEVELLLDQDRMLHGRKEGRDVLQSAIEALQSVPGSDPSPQPTGATHDARTPRNTP